MTEFPTHDFSGLICPLPVLKLRRKLSELAAGDSLMMIATDPKAKRDVALFCQQHGHELLRLDKEQDRWLFTIKKGR